MLRFAFIFVFLVLVLGGTNSVFGQEVKESETTKVSVIGKEERKIVTEVTGIELADECNGGCALIIEHSSLLGSLKDKIFAVANFIAKPFNQRRGQYANSQKKRN